MRDPHFSSRFMIDRRLDVLQKRSAAEHVQDLQSVADAENGLAPVVGIVQQQFVYGIAPGIGGRGLGIGCGLVLRGVDVGLASGQKYRIAALRSIS